MLGPTKSESGPQATADRSDRTGAHIATARWPVIGLAGAILLAQLGLTVANIGLPSMMSALGVSFAAVQWVVLGYLITMTALAVYAGRLGDRFGKRPMLFAGLALFAFASLLCTFAPNLALLVAGRALQGAGAALLNALALAMVIDVLPPGSSGAGLGALSATSAVGTMVGPTVGAFAMGLGGWRGIFALNLPLALVVYAILRVTTSTQARPAPVAARVTGGSRLPPVLPASIGAGILLSAAMASTLILAPFVLSRTFGLPLHAIGIVMGIGPLVTVLSALAAGRFADKLDARTVLLVAVVVFTLGAAGLATLRTDLGLIAYIIPIVFLGAGWGLFQTSNNHIVLGECDAASRGAVSGWMSLSRNVGLIGGTALIGTLFGAVTRGAAESGLAVAAAVRTSFTLGTAMVIVALALVVFVYVKRPATAHA